MEWVRQSPFLRRMELALCRPSRFHGAFCYYYNQSPCCASLSCSSWLSGRVLVVCGGPGEKNEACSLSALRRPLCPCLSVSVCRSGGLIVTHARLEGGRLTVTPGRSDRAVHGRIVGTQRARQDPTKQEHEDEQEQRSFDSATLELELELDPFRSPSACSPQSASQAARVYCAYQCRGSSAMSCILGLAYQSSARH